MLATVPRSEVDKFDQAYGQPANDQIFGHSPIPPGLGQTSIGAFFSDMTYYTNAGTGAGVLDSGTNNWIPALDDRAGCRPGGICESTMIQRITGTSCASSGRAPPPATRLRSPTGARSPASKTMTPNELGSRPDK